MPLSTVTKSGPQAGKLQEYSGHLPVKQPSKAQLFTANPKFWKRADKLMRRIFENLDRLAGPKPDKALYDELVFDARRKLKQGRGFAHQFVRGGISRGITMRQMAEAAKAAKKADSATPGDPAAPIPSPAPVAPEAEEEE